MTDQDSSRGDPIGRALSWGVHLFTASGAVLGLFAMVCIATNRLGIAVLLMLVSLAIDSFDGMLARAVKVSQHVPQIDGRRLDDLVDFLNFTIVPAFFMWSAESVLHVAWLVAPILASAMGFSRVDAKTEDDFFLGFPSYWNILAMYLWLLDIQPLAGTLWVVALSIAVFIPMKYLYPSKVQPASLRIGLIVGGIVWAFAVAGCVVWPDEAASVYLAQVSLAYPLWYIVLSFIRGGLKRDETQIAA